MITTLRSIERRTQRLALDAFDKASSMEALLPLIAQVTNLRPDLVAQNVFTLDWVTVYPQLRKWLGDRKTQKAFAGSLEFRPANYEITYDMDMNKINDEGAALLEAGETVPKIMQEFVDGKWDIAYAVLRDNVLAPIDGQNFFDTDHVQPDGSTTYSNLITPTRGAAATPTMEEMIAEYKAAQRRLLTNRLIRTRVRETTVAKGNLVAIAHSDAVESVLTDMLEQEDIDGNKNTFKGQFRLLRDPDPASGEENSWDLLWAEPNGPRPVIFVPLKEPKGVTFDESQLFRNGYVPYGADGRYAVTAAFPQTAVRSKP